MVYINFTKITPAAPNDPVVNEDTQLNDNWDLLETKVGVYVTGGAVSDLETGQELFNGSFRYGVWNGSTTRITDDIDAAWSAWTNIPMFSTRAVRSGFQPKWRNNTLLRKVELTGGVLFNAAADPWTMGTLFTINADSSGSPPAAQVPVGGTHICQCAVALTAGTSVTAGGYAFIDKPGGNTFTRIRVQYLGGGGGGNFVMLDQIWWWY